MEKHPNFACYSYQLLCLQPPMTILLLDWLFLASENRLVREAEIKSTSMQHLEN